MKRRGFLQTAGLALAGGARIATRRAESQERDSTTVQNKDAARPRVLIAAGDRGFADKMASALGETYGVVVADTADAVQRVRGCHAIVYSPEVSAIATDLELLDRHTRQLYALLTVAVAESVKAVVYLSSLRLMTSYPESYAVNEDFRPLPTSGPESFSPYLGEFVCREFAREGTLRAVVLRLGRIIDSTGTPNRPSPEPVTDLQDVCQVVGRALASGLAPGEPRPGAWQVFHVESGATGTRFDSGKARRVLRYVPRS